MSSLKLQPTEDGSYTFFSAEFGETFHSTSGAREEALRKFVHPLDLLSKAQQSSLQLLDICYGLGYNTAAALEAIWATNPNCQIELIALELDLSVPKAAIEHNLVQIWSDPIPEILAQLATKQQIQTDRIHATLNPGDARKTIQQIRSDFQADAIFLDPFSPPNCPQMWTVEFLGLVAQKLKKKGKLATYSCAAAVRTALIIAGLQIGSTSPVGRRSPGTLASFSADDLSPLSQAEIEHLQTRAAIPYRDPHLCDPAAIIWDRRKIEQETCSLESTARWKKRWLTTRS